MTEIYTAASGTDMRLLVNGVSVGECQSFDIDSISRKGYFLFVYFDRNVIDLFTKEFDFEIQFATDNTIDTPIVGHAEFVGVKWGCSIDDIVSEYRVFFKLLSCSLDR